MSVTTQPRACARIGGAALAAAAALLLALAGTARAAEAPDPGQAQALVEDVTGRMLGVLREDARDGEVDVERMRERVREEIVPHLDFVTMTKLAVGSPWRNASTEQKRTLVTEFRELLLRTYTHALDEYDNQELVFLPLRESPYEDRVTVRSKVIRADGPEIPVNYRLRYNDGEWKVYDIEVDGISLVTTYRSNFAGEIQSNGIDGLIAILEEKNANNELGAGVEAE